MQLVYSSAENTTITCTLQDGEILGNCAGPGTIYVPTDNSNTEYTAIVASGQPILPYVPSRAGVIAQSAQARSFADARQLNTQGRTQEAVAAILDLLEPT